MSGPAPPTISLPKGGGAVRGIGEKFASGPTTGTGRLTVPIATSPGRAGFGPELSLSYDSGAGTGLFGLGWSLSLPAITRKTDKGLPRYDDAGESDVFVLAGAEDLVPALAQTAAGAWIPEAQPPRVVGGAAYEIRRYLPRVEGQFARIERWRNRADPSDCFWRSIAQDDVTTWYGRTPESRIADPEDPARIFSWLICETHEDQGHVATYRYEPEDGTGVDHGLAHERGRSAAARTAARHPKRILYGNHAPYLPTLAPDRPWPAPPADEWFFEVVFDYGEHDATAPEPGDTGAWRTRPDPLSTYRAGFEVRTYRRCERVLMFHHFDGEPGAGANCLVRSTAFDYDEESGAGYSLLARITQTGHKRSCAGYRQRSLPPLELAYSRAEVDETVHDVDPASLEHLPGGVDGTRRQWVDLDGEGLTGILTAADAEWSYKRNVSAGGVRFAPAERPDPVPLPSALSGGRRLVDLDGDAQLDAAGFVDPLPGFYERAGASGWAPFAPFTALPNVDWSDPGLRFGDLTGDGRADLLLGAHDALCWHPSLGEEGFGAREPIRWAGEPGPWLPAGDGGPAIHLADVSGDGLSDLVRVENGAVSYWPNLGHGRFGARVAMDGAPRFDDPGFDPRRVRLADVDGSGTVDLLYLGRDGVDLYLNRSGNSWAPARRLRGFPPIDDPDAVSVVDLLGDGTACLVWSSALASRAQRPMRYVSLMSGGKPHLLTRIANNLGLETTLTYAPSTRFYLADERAGRPWASRLPFPVHVVERVRVHDRWRGTEFATTYSYHHGCYDGGEREFRGFGRVEQVDVERFDTFAAANAASPYVTDDLTLYQPPVKTVSWFHTGVPADLAREHYPPGERALPGPELPDGEHREALRACKGIALREEVYELDVDALHERGEHVAARLLSTAQHRSTVRLVQPRGENRHAVFHVAEREALTHGYELDLSAPSPDPDPRIAHTLNLALDAYGHVLDSVSAAYGRRGRHDDSSLAAADLALIRSVQAEPQLARTVVRFTGDVTGDRDAYRVRVPYDTRTYELSGIPVAGILTVEGLRAALPAAQPRLAEHTRTLYLRDDLAGPLPLGHQGRLGLLHETYSLALTDELLASVFGARLADTVDGAATAREKLEDEAVSGYLSGADLVARFSLAVPAAEVAGQYWRRSGTTGFAPGAQDHFYLPERHTDAFGAVTTVAFDDRDLFVASSTDPVGNTSSVDAFDFRVLAPRRHRDVNDNLREVAFDALGMVVASATLGKGAEADSLAGLAEDLEPEEIAALLGATALDEAVARGWLAGATARYAYDFGELREAAGDVVAWGERPAGACTIRRETHAAAPGGDDTALQVGVEYSDGAGQVLMRKRQAEPEQPGGDPRWLVDALTVVNNKGNAVKRYEPYFSAAFGYEPVAAAGVTALSYYDATGRLIRTEAADGNVTRVDVTPWAVASYDANDTVLEPGNAWYARNAAPAATAEERRAAGFAAGHAGSPAVTILDSLGRDVIAIARTRHRDGAGLEHDERLVSFAALDGQGRALSMRDPRGNVVARYVRSTPAGDVPAYDLAGTLLYDQSVDAGERWTLTDAAGHPMVAWTANERRGDDGVVVDEARVVFSEYDAAHRPTRQWLTVDGGAPAVVELFVYGEALPDAKARNLRTQLYRHYEGSGRLQNERFDFAGNLSEVSRRLTRDYRAPVVDWQAAPDAELDAETFVQVTEHDALGRMVRLYGWHHGAGSRVAVLEPSYDERGQLRSEALVLRATRTAGGYVTDPAHSAQDVIAELRYDAKGQPVLLRLGNGTVTRYDYDPANFRLRRLRTTRPGFDPPFPGAAATLSDPRVLQHLSFTYDAFGNVSAIRDDAFEPVFFRNQQVEAVSRYVYDGLYRLVEATGRESDQRAAPGPGEPAAFAVQFPVTTRTLRNYTERYAYDASGNLTELRHVAAGGSWIRRHRYAGDGNRLLATWFGDDEANATAYAHDRHGNLLNLVKGPPAGPLRWDYRDLMRAIDLGGGGWAHYCYHSGNRRSRQVVAATPTAPPRWERIHLDGLDLFRRYAGGVVVEEVESLHVFHGDRRLLLVEDVLQTDVAGRATGPLLRYQYADQVNSTTLEADEAAQIIGYEELHPYGSSAYRATDTGVEASPRRYRHTGMQRDAESGLDYHGARYYAPWLGRWISCDPAGLADGPNRYAYCRGSPVENADPEGTQTGPLGASGVYRLLETAPGVSTREHFLGGAQMRELLTQWYGKSAIGPIYDRLYKNSNATLLLNSVADPKTLGAPATATAPAIVGDTPLWRLMHADTEAGRKSDSRSWFLQNRRNFAGALLHGGFTPDKDTMERFDKGAIAQSRALFVGEKLAKTVQAGGKIPTRLAGVINPATPPNPPPAQGPGLVPVVKFAKPPSAAPALAAPATPTAPAAPAAAPAAPAAPSAPKPPAAGAWKGAAGTAAQGIASIGLPMLAGMVAQAVFDSPEAKSTASTLASGLTSVGVEWVGLVGPTMAVAGGTATATTVSAGVTTAFGATTLGGIAAGGTAAVGVAGAAVVAAGAAGYAVGTVINKAIVEPLLDKAAIGSGSFGDWWYRNVLK
jgi:RHS repeat-associated protein